MGSHLTCFQHRKGQKANAGLQSSVSSEKRTRHLGDDSDGEMTLSHQRLLQEHHDVLKRTIDPKGFLLLELLARDVLEDRDRQWIKAEKKDMEMNSRLIGWLMENDANTFAVFLESLRASHQQHIANLLEGKEGDRILTNEELQHITKVEPLLAILLDAKVGLVDMLYSCGAISKTDYQRICVRSTDYQINKKLLKVLMRSSDVTWQYFFEGLKETKQSHLLKYFGQGEVISAKVEMLPQSCRHVVRERAIMDQVNDVTRHLHSTPVSQYIEDNRLVGELTKINVECVCIHIESYIIFYFFCPSSVSLNQLWLLYQSGQLQNLIGDLFNTKLLESQHTQFKVTISKSDYKLCKKRLDSSDSAPAMSLHVSSSSSRSHNSISIQQLDSSILNLILLKAAVRRLKHAPPTPVERSKTFVFMSSVSSLWRDGLSDKEFIQKLCVHIGKECV